MSKQIQKYRLGYAIYRRNIPVKDAVYGEKDGRVQYCKEEEDEVRVEEGCEAEEEQFNDIDEPNRKSYKVVYSSKSKFWSATTLIPKSFMGLFIGSQGANKKKVEKSTECEISFPDRSKKQGPIVIKSAISAENVERCLDQIEMFVAIQRSRARPTHFVSLALESDELLENYSTLRTLVTNSSAVSDESKQPELFMPSVRLHVTLCMLGLLSDLDKKKVIKALNEVVENEVKPMLKSYPLTINIKGLSHFGEDDPSEARVLFANTNSVKLLEIHEVVSNKMISTGLAKQESREFVPHMTVMNVKYLKDDEIRTFDANFILRDFSNFDFGSAVVSDIKICSLNTDPKTGNYVVLHAAPFASTT